MTLSLQEKVREFNRRIGENPDLISAPAEKLFDAETDFYIASTVSDSYMLCGVKVPAPSIGVIMLLTCVNSPFVTTASDASLKDVIECLFIIKYRSVLGSYLLKKKETDVVLAKLEHDSRDNMEMYSIFMNKLLENRTTEYDDMLVQFSETLKDIELATAVIEIGRYLGKPLKKKCKSRISTGLLGTLQKYAVRTYTMFFGK